MKRKLAVGALAAALVAFGPPAAIAAEPGGILGGLFGGLNVVSTEQEAELAATFARDVESKQRIVRDREIQSFVDDVGRRLVSTLRRPDFRYRFRVVSDPSVNAFGIGGGYVYVHSGLLASARTEGEFASVMAHEIGHQVRRHVAKAISRQAVFQSLARAAMGSKSSQWADLAASLGITTGQRFFGREAEREADDVMIELMRRASYDPREALGLFETLRRLEGGRGGGGVAAIFSSHPPTSERAERIEREIGRARPGGNLIRDSRRFQEIRRRLTSNR